MAKVSDYIRLTCFINFRSQGFSEAYALVAGNIETAVPDALQIASWRAELLGTEAKIVWAKLERMNDLRRSYAIVPNRFSTALVAALPDPGKIPVGSTIEAEKAKISGCDTGFMFRFETSTGNHSNRMIRAVPDCLVQARENALPFFALPASNDPLAQWAPGSPYLTCMTNYLQWVRKRTLWNHDYFEKDLNGKSFWLEAEQEPFSNVFQRGVFNKKTGRPFAMSRGRAPRRG